MSLCSRSPFSAIRYSIGLAHRLRYAPHAPSWTSAINAFSGDPATAFALFVSMLRLPCLPTQSTISILFKILSVSPHCLPLGHQLHSLSLKLFLSSVPFSGSALISFYSKHRRPADALKALDEIPHADEVCFAAIIVGLAQNHRPADALSLFRGMRVRGIASTMYSVSAALRASAELAALEQTRVVHGHAFIAGLEPNSVVGTALVDAYGKSGFVPAARQMFDELSSAGGANLVTWNAVLSAYAQQGDALSARQLFNKMLKKKFEPDEYTFLAVLTAFSNCGMVDETQNWLVSMCSIYGIEPGLEHHSCLLGAMTRAGKLVEAEHFALTMPYEPDTAVWRTLLSGCMVHGNADVGGRAAERLLELDPQDDSAFVMMANIYSSIGEKEETAMVWTSMRDHGVKKEGGRSWIEVMGDVHVFVSGDHRHQRSPEIYAKVRDLVREAGKLGYVQNGEEVVWQHSERLAVALGLLSGSAAAEGKVLRVIKNLRICRDCHEFFKYTSRVVERHILVRDVNRYHWFLDGDCSCKDCW